MTDQLKNTIIVGVDPAPSKGLCVYAYDPDGNAAKNAGFKRYYAATNGELQDFANTINEFGKKRPVLICWDAPLTMPPGCDDFYTREIDKIWRDAKNKWRKAAPIDACSGGWASVQPFASCSHWAISQKVVGHPRFPNVRLELQSADTSMDQVGHPRFPNVRLEGSLINAILLTNNEFNALSNGVYITEVHPALAMQVAHGSATLRKKVQKHSGLDLDVDCSWKLSGRRPDNRYYKNVSWNGAVGQRDQQSGFATLCDISQIAFDEANVPSTLSCRVREEKLRGKLRPSDHLDAWVSMRLGVLWLQRERVKLYGNRNMGSFLLPAILHAASEERIVLKTILANQNDELR